MPGTYRPKQTTLCYQKGNSDKAYHVSLERKGDLFVVDFVLGDLGSTLRTGTKTARPTDYSTTLRLFNTPVLQKKNKGYSEGVDGAPYQHKRNHSPGKPWGLYRFGFRSIRATTSCALRAFASKLLVAAPRLAV